MRTKSAPSDVSLERGSLSQPVEGGVTPVIFLNNSNSNVLSKSDEEARPVIQLQFAYIITKLSNVEKLLFYPRWIELIVQN